MDHRQLGARLVFTFELAEVTKREGMYLPELTVEELLKAISLYTAAAHRYKGTYDEDDSDPELGVIDLAIAAVAIKAVLAIVASHEQKIRSLEEKIQEHEHRTPPDPAIAQKQQRGIEDDDIPF